MPIHRIFAWIPPICLLCFLVMVSVRAYMLRRRGIRARVFDPERSRAAKLVELAATIIFWGWVVMVAAFTYPRPPAWLPAWLSYQLIDSSIAQWIGAVFVIVPTLIYPIALAEMGNSWRIGIDRDAHDHEAAADAGTPPAALITHGLYHFARNPIYVIVNMLYFGVFLIHGRVIFLPCAVLFVFLVHLQVLREEEFLAARYGDDYADYRRRVRRYGLI